MALYVYTTDAVLKGTDNKNLTACVLGKAFDSVDHRTILCKLRDVGASAIELQWINSYFQIGTELYEFILPFLTIPS